VAQQRRLLLSLTALAAACATAQALTGVSQLALYLTPLFLIGALLLSGHYVGEQRIVARVRAANPPERRLRRTAQRWRPPAVRVLRSLHEKGSFGVRGPPALLAPAA
jgi:hypothetical protein